MNYLKRKYMTLMRGVNFQGYLRKANGNPSVLTDCISNSPMWLSVFGNSTQDGTPTPDNPIEIQSVGDLVTDETSEYYGKYDIPITVMGKNLLSSRAKTATLNGVTLTYDNGIITLNGTCTASNNFLLNKLILKAGTYTLSGNANKIPVLNGYTFVYVYDATNNQRIDLRNKDALGSSTATTFIDGTFEYRIRIDNGCTYDNVILHPQLELGSVATSYEPYKGSETIHIYLDEPLRKVRDYADYIDFKNKKVVRNVVQGVLNGSESWQAPTTRYYYYNTKLNIKCLGISVAGIMSNALPSKSWTEIRNSGTGIAICSDNRIDIRASGIWTSVDEAKEYMKNNPIQYIAPCLVPTEEDISLPALKALKGTNVISVDTSVIPSNMECEYYSTTKQEEE